MRSGENCIAKGIYGHHQISGYLSVRQFIIVEKDGKKCLLLRFENEASFDITQAEFSLKQLNSKGDVIDVSTIGYSNMKIRAGQMYALKEGIVLKNECFDFIIQMISLTGGRYRYSFNGDIVSAHYDKPEYRKNTAGRGNAPSSIAKVTRGYSDKSVVSHSKIAGLSLLLIGALFIAIVSYNLLKPQIAELLKPKEKETEYRQTEKYL